MRRRVAALALEVVASKSETQGHLSGCGEQSSRTWSSFHLTRGTHGIVLFVLIPGITVDLSALTRSQTQLEVAADICMYGTLCREHLNWQFGH